MAKQKKIEEHVAISFHYLFRVKRVEEENYEAVPFSEEEFDQLYTGLSGLKDLDYADTETNFDIRMQKIVPVEVLERDPDNPRIITGVHFKAYSGHEVKNIDVGVIKKNSISFRPFFFILYLAEDGRIFIGCQTLGNYGGYSALRDTLKSLFYNRKNIRVASVRSQNYLMKDAKSIEEIELPYSKKGSSISSENIIGQRGAIVFKNKDENFSEQVKKRIWPLIGKERKILRKGITALANEAALISMDDEDLDGCRLVAILESGQKKVIQLMETKGFATHFSTGVEPSSLTGHPEYKPLKIVAKEILKEEIIGNA